MDELKGPQGFCPLCGYALDLHGDCETAEKKAKLMSDMLGVFVR